MGGPHKVFWPQLKLTKGDLMRYYVEVAPFILPVVADRPLVMKRFPNGIDAPQFYQHRALDVPPGVRTEIVTYGGDTRPQMVGGDLLTLLYMAQLAAISQDPWFSRVQSPDEADYVAIDLDPMPDVHVLAECSRRGAMGARRAEIARRGWLTREPQAPKGSTSIFPLLPGTPVQSGPAVPVKSSRR